MSQSPSIVWFRLDLRLEDQPALQAAIERGGPVLPLFIDTSEEEGSWSAGGASRWWLHASLKSLAMRLEEKGSSLVLRKGPARSVLFDVIQESGAGAVYWNRRYEPTAIARDQEIKEALRARGLEAESFNSALLFEPWEIKNKSGECFKVFTPFWKTCVACSEPKAPVPEPEKILALAQPVQSLKLSDLQLEPKPDWAAGMREMWRPGELGAQAELEIFLNERMAEYLEKRDLPAWVGTSRLSPHLHFGEIGPRQIWHAVKSREARDGMAGGLRNAEGFLRQIGWREFAHHLLYHFPRTPEHPLRREYSKFPWQKDHEGLRVWQRGQTGFPIVDAGMRELWSVGWMHNRVRMIVASFLVKDLLIPWQEGAKWFWNTLVDADLANNTLGWQWIAGCGADAAPYFRIFNPVLQGQKFDPEGKYVRRWIPELQQLPNAWIHQPWAAPAETLAKAGVELGKNYPHPIVDHGEARNRALAALKQMTQGDVLKLGKF